ncbi:hypothetical protein RND71_010524 [Anisodus tanguticus]|uniref:Choline kinase n=1 Tax=Anisodus tanguticus TaxID=243964 RepID=A0AAE1VS83_9SOLA|nr:hypothetical protein RND71_010524 [Anisodus tanguticus]
METNQEGSLEKGNLPEELVKILKSLALEWGDDVDHIDNDLEIVRLTNSFTNQIYRMKWPGKTQENNSRSVLVRKYGERRDLFLDSEEEMKTFEWMSNHGYGPRLYGYFPDGRVEEFIHGRTLSQNDLWNPEISALVAAKMKEFHMIDKPGSKSVILWMELRNMLSDAKRLCSPEIKNEFGLENLEEEIDILEKELSKDSNEIVFCHNDLRGDNVLFNEATKDLTLIDYEYAWYNAAAYDLANHFCEWAANYNSETPHHILDYSKYPSPEERQRFIRIYLSHKGHQPTEFEVEKFDVNVEKYTLANHLNFGLWAIISEVRSTNSNFDFLGFARTRFQQYQLKYPKYFNEKLSKSKDTFDVMEEASCCETNRITIEI